MSLWPRRLQKRYIFNQFVYNCCLLIFWLSCPQIDDISCDAEVGKLYDCTVKSVLEEGAVVEYNGGRHGLLHISELSTEEVFWKKKNVFSSIELTDYEFFFILMGCVLCPGSQGFRFAICWRQYHGEMHQKKFQRYHSFLSKGSDIEVCVSITLTYSKY